MADASSIFRYVPYVGAFFGGKGYTGAPGATLGERLANTANRNQPNNPLLKYKNNDPVVAAPEPTAPSVPAAPELPYIPPPSIPSVPDMPAAPPGQPDRPVGAPPPLVAVDDALAGVSLDYGMIGAQIVRATKRKKLKAKAKRAYQILSDLYQQLAPWIQTMPMPGELPRRGVAGRILLPTSGRQPPKYQRGAVARKGLPSTVLRSQNVRRGGRTGPRGGRIGQARPRSRAAVPGLPRPRPAPLPAGVPDPIDDPTPGRAAPERKTAPITQPGALPGTTPNAPGQPGRIAEPARRSQPRPRTANPSPGGVPGTGSRPGKLPSVLGRTVSQVALETLLRVATRQSPSVPKQRNPFARSPSLPIGDFPAGITTPVGNPSPIPGSPASVNPGQNYGLITLPAPFAAPRQALAQKKCKCPEKKKREPRPPRTTCKSGTYKQTSKGVSYHPTKEVPCA